LLENSVEDHFQKCKRKFSLKTVLLLADQMIRCLEQLHSKNFIHRDIKPENFMMGLTKKATSLFLIDFGLSKRFRDPQTGLHIPFRDHKSFTGTARYASINTHMGAEQSRRDDLESVGHLLIYLLKGCLPWQNLQATNKKEKYDQILQKKVETPIDILCQNLPMEFGSFLEYCRKMKFNERPDYSYILRMFKDLFFKHGYIYDMIYDWSLQFQHTQHVTLSNNLKFPNKKADAIPQKPIPPKTRKILESKENRENPDLPVKKDMKLEAEKTINKMNKEEKKACI
jgi:serine/threonine protein kinase